MEEEKIEKAVKTENFIRAMQEINHIIHTYGFDIHEAIGLLSSLLTAGFVQMEKNGDSLETIKCMLSEVSAEMYEELKKTTKIKEK